MEKKSEKKLALAVYLYGKHLGTCQLPTFEPMLGPYSPQDGIEGCISCVCFHREDDLLAVHSFDEFTVKGVAI